MDKDNSDIRRKQCSYCFIMGHTRKTCEYLKSDRTFLVEANLKYRRLVVEGLIDNGICPGSLVAVSDHTWSHKKDAYVNEETLALVKKIRWESINFTSTFIIEPHVNTSAHERVILAEKINSKETESMTLPYHSVLTPHYKMYSSYRHDVDTLWHHGHKIISAIPDYIVMATVPGDFLSTEESSKFVSEWIRTDPYSKNKRKRRSRAQVKIHRFSPLMGRAKTLSQEEKVFYE